MGRGRHGRKKPSYSKPEDTEKKGHYQEIVRENAQLTTYYQKQELVPAEEWNELMTCLASGLPTTFRITGHREEAEQVRKYLLEHFVPNLSVTPRQLEWYEPQGMAWHLDSGRKSVRTDAAYAEFHRWLVSATENGDISRQEAVSMVPPLLLDARAHHRVLDLCAAPGSKTAQILEYMHADALATGFNCPSGLLIANDADQQRAYMLHHQVKRLLSPSLLVSNNDGTQFATMHALSSSSDSTTERVLFDRILADVPCSGDGTFRKNALLWKSWNPNHALGLHSLQVRLLERAIRLLKVGGRLVYSTCSMNFVENEAVVAHILSRYPTALQLLDVSSSIPALKRRPGRSTWKVLGKDGIEFADYKSVPSDLCRRFPSSVFPRTEYQSLHLDRCLRIYPHFQNTGGFFVAVIVKHGEIQNPVNVPEKRTSNEENSDLDPSADVAQTAERQPKSLKPKYENPKFGVPKAEGEYRMLDPETDETLASIFEYYGINRQAILKSGFGFLVRSDRRPIKSIVIISAATAPILAATVPKFGESQNDERIYNRSLKIVNAGVRGFEIYESSRQVNAPCAYRLLTESLYTLMPLITKRKFFVERTDMISLIESQDSIVVPLLTNADQGGVVLETTTSAGTVVAIPAWISAKGPKAFVPNTNRPALLLQLRH